MRVLSSRRLPWLLLVAVVAAAAGVGGALAEYPDSNVTHYAACLNTGGSSAGTFSQIAVGDTPSKTCGSNQVAVHLSGGDITNVTAGTGLTGGGDNGAVTLGLDSAYSLPQSCSTGNIPGWSGSNWDCYAAGAGLSADATGKTLGVSGSYQLPQSCSDKQVAKWNQTDGAWNCADDNSYSNGTGLDLSNSNEFSLQSGYQLPQSCNYGQVPVSGGNNTWSCHSISGSMSQYVMSWHVELGDDDTESAYAYCNNGDIRTGGGFDTDSDAKGSAPYGSNGWVATASTGFGFGFNSGYVNVYVDCLHVS